MADANEIYEAIDVVLDGLIDPREYMVSKLEVSDVHIPAILQRKKKKKLLVKKSWAKDRDQGVIRRTKPTIPIAESAARGKKIVTRTKIGAGLALAGGAGYALKKYIDKPKLANQEPVIKSVTWDADITGIDEDKRQVFGWCTVTHVNGEEVTDKQGDYIPLDEIEKAAYNYVLTSRKGGDMHARDGDGPKHTADLIESVVFTPEKLKGMGINPDAVPNSGWWVGMKVNNDEQWKMVKNDERTAFSIHGKGKRTDRD